MKIHNLTIILSTFAVLSCASQTPVIDTKGVDMSAYTTELSECEAYAEQISMGTEAAVGAGIGAALGWAISAAAGNYDNDASAAVGAVTGGASGMRDAAQSAEVIIKNCLRGRGYRVLN